MKPVSRTAYYCCGVRALDAQSPRPVCGDTLAGTFMDDEAWATFAPFRVPEVAPANASNVARHRIIDDLLRARLATDPEHRIVIVGAGFDTRAFRLPGGRWLEIDEPALIRLKEERLPAASAPNPLTRLELDFSQETLAERLRPFATDEPVTAVVEGVIMYLTVPQRHELARALRGAFPRVTLIADLMTAPFYRKYGITIASRVAAFGAHFQIDGNAHPLRTFEAEGFRAKSSQSIVGRSSDEGMLDRRLPPWPLSLLFRTLREGYQVWELEAP